MKNILLGIMIMLCLKTGFGASLIPGKSVYLKGGADYFGLYSDKYSMQRIHPLQGSLVPTISSGTINGGNWAGNVAFGFTYAVNPTWKLSPELSYTPIGRYSKTQSPFLLTPYGAGFINRFHAKMNANVIAAVLNIERSINKKYAVYVAPALGVALVNTNNSLAYQASEDERYFLMESSQYRSNFSFQAAVGVKYEMYSNLFLDLGINYIWLGNIPLGTYSMDSDKYTRTEIAARHASLFGPKVNLIFYFS